MAFGPSDALRERLRASKALIVVELAAVAAIFVADDVFHLIFFSKTLYLLALGWLSLWVRGVGWRGVGLTVPPNWRIVALGGLVGGVLMEGLELFVTQPLLVKLTGTPPDLSDFHGLIGNPKLLALGLLLVWTLAAFGEEMVYRGYLLNRLADLFGRKPAGWLSSLVVATVVFGLAHWYQGVTGMTENAIDGLLLAGLYFASGRNLMAPIIAHGVTDSLDLLLVFTNHYPTPV